MIVLQQIYLSMLLENKSIDDGNNINIKFKMYEILLTYIISQYEILEKIVNKYIPLFELRDNVDFRNSIDEYIKEANDENIITYLKIRNDEDKTGIYNDRFNIKMNKQQNTEPNKVMIEYMDDNFPYYKKTLMKDQSRSQHLIRISLCFKTHILGSI